MRHLQKFHHHRQTSTLHLHLSLKSESSATTRAALRLRPLDVKDLAADSMGFGRFNSELVSVDFNESCLPFLVNDFRFWSGWVLAHSWPSSLLSSQPRQYVSVSFLRRCFPLCIGPMRVLDFVVLLVLQKLFHRLQGFFRRFQGQVRFSPRQ